MKIASFVRAFTMSAALAASAFASDVTGKWVGKMETPNGTRDSVINLKQDGEKLTGTMPGRGGETPISEGSIKGDDVAFTVVRNFGGEERKINYKGRVASGQDGEINVQARNRRRDRLRPWQKQVAAVLASRLRAGSAGSALFSR